LGLLSSVEGNQDNLRSTDCCSGTHEADEDVKWEKGC